MNEQLGNTGTTVRYVRVPQPELDTADLAAFVADKNVDTVVLIGCNPVYDAPADMNFAAKLKSLPNSVHLSSHDDETSRACRWHLTRAHALESWGDGTAWDGTISVQQPMILPLFGGRTPAELIALMAGESNTAGFDIVRRTFEDLTGKPMTPADKEPAYDPAWRRTLHAGVLEGSTPTAETPPVQRSVASVGASTSGLELNFTPSYALGNGQFANNGWLQELPDPLTKLTWENAFLMHQDDADAAGVSDGDEVTVKVGSASVNGPVIVQPGQTKGTISVALGWGRAFPGRVCTDAGFDAYAIRKTNGMWSTGDVSVTATGNSIPLARTQMHFAIDSVGGEGTQERLPMLFREGSLDTFNSDPSFAKHMSHSMGNLSLWQSQQFDGADNAWGMTVDLNKCIGCGDCIMACQAENNIPIVGKDQVIMGREMHWLRIDRYYRFKSDGHGGYDVTNPGTVAMQPMMCQHCENAPCEQVCPVAATVHTADGLNAMVYNRCVGTRYCSNNCPYKVRRFNFFDYFRRDPLRETGMLQVQPDYYVRRQSGGEPLRRMQFNPDVTVRMRGVMEKCTWCTQRIESAKIQSRNAWVKLPEAEKAAARRVFVPDGTITPACAQTCPTQAIVFGDLMDTESEVSTLQKDNRAYALLSELHIKPRNLYLARLSNPIDGERYPEDHAGHGGHGDHAHTDSHEHGGTH
jgi:Fe-S-cluster-containing dehydrogenase component